MTVVKSDVVKKLMDAKRFLLQGYLDEGVKIVKEVVNSLSSQGQQEQYNWLICNVIESIECRYMFDVLEQIGSYFDLYKCQNLKNVVECGIINNSDNRYVELALDILTKQGKRDRLEEIAKDALKNQEVNGKLLLIIAQALKRVGNERDAVVLLNEACKKGVKEACSNVIVPPSSAGRGVM
ncbi:MAG: DUF1955 domain-containing protein [Sulfolobus sp.]